MVNQWNQNHDFNDLYVYRLASAYELNGDFEKAVEIYQNFDGTRHTKPTLPVAFSARPRFKTPHPTGVSVCSSYGVSARSWQEAWLH